MRDSARKHMDDLLKDFSSQIEELNARKKYIMSVISGGSCLSERVSGGEMESEQDRYMRLVESDKTLSHLLSWLRPIARALDSLDGDERQLIEHSYFYGIGNEKVMELLDMDPSMFYRRKKSALSKLARNVFGVYADE